MLEILPIKSISEEEGVIFGAANVALAKLARTGFPVAPGIIITAPALHLKTVLEHYQFHQKEIFEQSLTLVKKEIAATPVPELLIRETKNHDHFYLASQESTGSEVKGVKKLWQELLDLWLEEVKQRLWQKGFYPGIADGLSAARVIFVKKPKTYGAAFFDPFADDVIINSWQGSLHPNDQRKLLDLVTAGNKKLLIPQEYEWMEESGLKIIGLKPYTPAVQTKPDVTVTLSEAKGITTDKVKSTVKVLLDMSEGLVVERDVDGVYIAAEKIFDLSHAQDSLEQLIFKIVESAKTFPDKPVLVKLADFSGGMGQVRGALRLIHQSSLLVPQLEAIVFARNKKGLHNINIVLPFVRTVSELLQLKRELAAHKLIRKSNLQIWMEVALPENVINLEEYLTQGLDGVVLNLDELSAHLNGYDPALAELAFYKHQIFGVLKFIEDAIRLLHKAKIPFIASGTLSLNPEILDFLVEHGIYGIVAPRIEAPSLPDFLHQAEKRMILRKAT